MNTLQAKTAYLGGNEIKEVRLGNKLVLAPNGDMLWYKANEVPSLDLRFAENKSLVDATSGQNLVTFTRASSGTYVDSTGTIRTATTNLLVRSEEFDNASWALTRCLAFGSGSIANAVTAPNGTLTADKVVEDTTATSTHFFQQTIAVAATTTYTGSVYIKAAERTWVLVSTAGTPFGSHGGYVNLSDGSVGTTAGTLEAFSVTPAGNGWYRISWTMTTGVSGSGGLQVRLATGNGGQTYTGDGTSGIFIWGAQLEQSSTVGEYIPTTSTINSAPRFDHDPTTGESLGLLVEEQRTNLLLYSEDFSNAAYAVASGSVTANTSTAPDGATTADTVSSTGTTVVFQSLTKAASSIAYVASLFVKGSVTDFNITIDDGTTANRGRARFNLSTGTMGSVTSEGEFTGASGSIIPVSGNFYRLALAVITNAATTVRFRLFWTGSGTSVDFWGAQLEAGAFPTSYIPTTTAAATRAADVATDTTRGAALRSLYAQFRSPASGTRPIVSLDDNTANERIEILTSGTDPKLLVTDGGSAVANLNGGTVTANVAARIAARFNTDDYAISINGGASQLDSSGTLPAVDRIRIGSNQAGGYFNGTIARIAGWDAGLPLLPMISQ